jgi:hypothetical protein
MIQIHTLRPMWGDSHSETLSDLRQKPLASIIRCSSTSTFRMSHPNELQERINPLKQQAQISTDLAGGPIQAKWLSKGKAVRITFRTLTPVSRCREKRRMLFEVVLVNFPVEVAKEAQNHSHYMMRRRPAIDTVAPMYWDWTQCCEKILHEELDLCPFSREERSSQPRQSIRPEIRFETKAWMLRVRSTMLSSASHSDLHGATGLRWPPTLPLPLTRVCGFSRLADWLCELVYLRMSVLRFASEKGFIRRKLAVASGVPTWGLVDPFMLGVVVVGNLPVVWPVVVSLPLGCFHFIAPSLLMLHYLFFIGSAPCHGIRLRHP